MFLTYCRNFLTKNDIKILILFTLTGCVMQLLANKYIKNHPEIFIDKEITPRGGALIELTAVKVYIPKIIIFLSQKGRLVGFLSSVGLIIVKKVPMNAVATVLRDASPQNLSHLNKGFVLIDGEKFYFDKYDQHLKYLAEMLLSKDIPFEEREKIARRVFKHLDLRTMNGRTNFILCMILLLYLLSSQNTASYFILLRRLLKAIRQGKISKAMARFIIKRLQKKGLILDPDLVAEVYS
jgi:hypothetical protein